MENINEISDLLVQAPMALIVLVFIWLMFRVHTQFIKDIMKIIKELTKD